jgi:hypothetical protein
MKDIVIDDKIYKICKTCKLTLLKEEHFYFLSGRECITCIRKRAKVYNDAKSKLKVKYIKKGLPGHIDKKTLPGYVEKPRKKRVVLNKKEKKDKTEEEKEAYRLYVNETSKKWRENKENKDKLTIWMKTINKCECGGKYTNSGKSSHFNTTKHTNFKNNIFKTEIELQKEKEERKIKQDIWMKTKIVCQCGGRFTNSGKWSHEHSQLHIDFIKKGLDIKV